MSKVYSLGSADVSPLSLNEAKAYMRVLSVRDDTIITSMINAATSWGENYTGRDFRRKSWTLKQDFFWHSNKLDRDPVAAITSVKYQNTLNVEITVDPALYYLKKLTQYSELLIDPDSSWPTDLSDREHAVTIDFDTAEYYEKEEIFNALQQHVLYLYTNRGDCGCDKESADKSGSTLIYDQFRISRI